MLRAGATAREMLIAAAAEKWNVPETECYAEKGSVIHRPSGKKFGYGELVEAAAKLKPPTGLKLKERKDYKIIGKPMPRLDNPAKPMAPRFSGSITGYPDSYTQLLNDTPVSTEKSKGSMIKLPAHLPA